MHESAIETVVEFLREHGLCCSTWGEREHRTRGVSCKVENVEYLFVFEQGELPDLNINYVGADRQFINERFTAKSFPDLLEAVQKAMAKLAQSNVGGRCGSNPVERFSVSLVKRYCDVLLRRIQRAADDE